jgi:hypothetical protein
MANAGEDQSVCIGTPFYLNAEGGQSYKWSPSDGLSDVNINNPIAMISKTTTYTVTVTDDMGCTASDNVVVYISQLPSINAGMDVTICNGRSATLTAVGSSIYGGVKYGWSNYSENQTIIVNPTITTTYIVTVIDTIPNHGCMNYDTVVVYYSEVCPGIDENDIHNIIKIYPNPFSGGQLNILFNLSEDYNLLKLELFDIKGYSLLSIDENLLSRNSYNIDINNKGIYFLRITTDKGTLVKKIVAI